jgi:hypothetical protein
MVLEKGGGDNRRISLRVAARPVSSSRVVKKAESTLAAEERR